MIKDTQRTLGYQRAGVDYSSGVSFRRTSCGSPKVRSTSLLDAMAIHVRPGILLGADYVNFDLLE
jgi:hypothetical protein